MEAHEQKYGVHKNITIDPSWTKGFFSYPERLARHFIWSGGWLPGGLHGRCGEGCDHLAMVVVEAVELVVTSSLNQEQENW